MLELVQGAAIVALAVTCIAQGMTQRRMLRAIASLTQAISRRQP